MSFLRLAAVSLPLVMVLAAACGGNVTIQDPQCQGGDCEGCYVDGEYYEVGFSYADACGSCTCEAGGNLVCQDDGYCGGGCTYDGQYYGEGESWTDVTGCATCYCEFGEAYCEGPGCEQPVCFWDDQYYYPGDQFPAGDGCNSCVCGDFGDVSCTERACACNPDGEWWRDYVSLDPSECQLIDFACPGATFGFYNECGCGCEQSSECAQTYDCKPNAGPPCDVAWISENCPYSYVLK